MPAGELWRVDETWLEEAKDDATALAVRDMEEAGIDVVTDGEIRRESYSNHFANALEGLDLDNPGTALDRTGHPNPVPRVVGPIRRTRPVGVRDTQFLRALTTRPIRVTVPGPFTMSQQAQNDHYPDLRSLALAYAEAVNEELRDLAAAGADVVQIDEPYLQARPDDAGNMRSRRSPVRSTASAGRPRSTRASATRRSCTRSRTATRSSPSSTRVAADQISIEAAQPRLDPSLLEQLPSKQVILGVLDLGDMSVETPDVVAERIRAALRHIEPERLLVAPDCGMKYLPRDVARGKLRALVEGAAAVRAELLERAERRDRAHGLARHFRDQREMAVVMEYRHLSQLGCRRDEQIQDADATMMEWPLLGEQLDDIEGSLPDPRADADISERIERIANVGELAVVARGSEELETNGGACSDEVLLDQPVEVRFNPRITVARGPGARVGKLHYASPGIVFVLSRSRSSHQR